MLGLDCVGSGEWPVEDREWQRNLVVNVQGMVGMGAIGSV